MEGENICSFYSTVCHVCKIFPSGAQVEKPLKRCQGCKLIAYCSVDHQQQHWPEHREFCRVLKKLVKKLNVSFIYENAVDMFKKEWCDYRFKLKILCELMLKRCLTVCETEMLYFPRVCLLCHAYDKVNLRDCEACHCVSYCSDEHMQEDAEFHHKSCHELKVGFDLDMHGYHGTLPIIRQKFLRRITCDSSSQFHSAFMEQMSQSEEISIDPVASRVYLTLLSCPLTFIDAVFKSNLHLAQKLVVHMIGASRFETQHLGTWDVVFHWLTHLQSLHLVLIGPDVIASNEAFLCSHCEEIGCKLMIEFCPRQLYHDYIESGGCSKPDIIVMFNSGISEFNGGKEDLWQNSIPYIMLSECPVVMTSYTASEAEKDLQRLTEAKTASVSIIVRSEKNEFSSKKPVRDWEHYDSHSDSLLFYHNAFVSLLVPHGS